MSYRSLLGIAVFLFIAWIISENRRQVSVRDIVTGLLFQFLMAFLVFKVPVVQSVLGAMNAGIELLLRSTQAGTTFVFGYMGGGEQPFATTSPSASTFILAFQGFPLMLVISALSSLLFYWRILPIFIKGISWALEKTLRVGGALGLGSAANIFMGFDSAPLLIKPYLPSLSRSELFAFATVGMATVAGNVMGVYVTILGGLFSEGVLGHIFAASLINVPAALTISRIMIPETETITSGRFDYSNPPRNSIEAISRGAVEGAQMWWQIVVMLIVFVALIYLANSILGYLPNLYGQPITLQGLLGYVMAPVVWLMGIPWSEAFTAGSLMGTKTVLNELIAYSELARLPEGALSYRSELVMVYAMCGFANLGSIGILIGSIGGLIPSRRAEISTIALKAVLSGTLATLVTGCLVGIFIPL
jgi:CNT family concentrative nucleoside transporter